MPFRLSELEADGVVGLPEVEFLMVALRGASGPAASTKLILLLSRLEDCELFRETR